VRISDTKEVSGLGTHSLTREAQNVSAKPQLRLSCAVTPQSSHIAGHQSAAGTSGVVPTRVLFLSTWNGIGSIAVARQRPGKIVMPPRSSQILSSGSSVA
jgi:hypothetical protein